VPTLEALATAAPAEFGTIAVALDARRGEVYLGCFRRRGDALERLHEDRALPPEAAARAIAVAAGGGPAVLLGDGAAAYPAAFAVRGEAVAILGFERVRPSGTAIALGGVRRLERGEIVRPEGLLPTYVRASEAEVRRGRATLTVERAVS
jgi:tRNA threonylcarbamoyladenosine biosynthesis protein TsaB